MKRLIKTVAFVDLPDGTSRKPVDMNKTLMYSATVDIINREGISDDMGLKKSQIFDKYIPMVIDEATQLYNTSKISDISDYEDNDDTPLKDLFTLKLSNSYIKQVINTEVFDV